MLNRAEPPTDPEATPSAARAGPLPGAAPLPEAIAQQLASAWQARPEGYLPRTKHLETDGSPAFTNRLLLESSPYLRQHAHNPVNWFPWGDEAFEFARQ
jgi:hypothetical protein